MSNKIIAFSLWGQPSRYVMGAIRNAQLARQIYPDWKCRFYCGPDVSADTIKQLLDLGSECEFMEEVGWNGMFWRFYAADGEDTMLSRDADSRLSYREKAAVAEWLDSDKDFHIIRDHPYHQTEILGGMWGCRNGLLRGIKNMIHLHDKGHLNNKWQVDQVFLTQVIYPLVKDKALEHDHYKFNNFPRIPRHPQFFVGQAYDGNDKVLDDYAYFFDYIREEEKYDSSC